VFQAKTTQFSALYLFTGVKRYIER